MLINWPDNLIEEIAYRRCLLFLGSGISACAKNEKGEFPLTWEEFIIRAKEMIPKSNDKTLDFIDKMISQRNFLFALQAIYNKCDKGRYSNFLKQVYNRANYIASKIHEYIKEIDSKVVITTNFDKIYENLCKEHVYTVATYKESQKILSNLKSRESLIIKAHGSIDDVDSLVFTQEQYRTLRNKYHEFYNLLNALFLTNTVVFLGYSLNDPDINLILEDVANSSSPSCPNYIVVKEKVDEEIQEHWRKSYNISCLEYGPSYDDLEVNIKNLHDEVLEFREMRKIP